MLKLFRHLKPYTIPITGVIFLFFLRSLTDLYLPTLMADIVDIGIMKGDEAYIFRMGGYMVLIALAGVCCAVMSSFFSARVVNGFSRTLRSMLFSRVQNFSLAEYDRIGSSSLITRTTNDVTQVQQSLQMMLTTMLRAPVMCVGGILMSVALDPKLSLVFALVVPLLMLIVWTVTRKALPLNSLLQARLDRLNLVIREKLTGIREMRAFNREAFEAARFAGASRDLTATALDLAMIVSLLMPAMMLCMNITTIAITWFGGLRAEAGNMQVGAIMAFIQYVLQILFALIMGSILFIMIPRAQVSAQRINEVLDLEPEIRDPQGAPEKSGKKGYVEFRNVSFTYHGAGQPALNGITFSACPGEVTAVIGGTGSGKSTMMSLIPRFYDAGSGEVLVDGLNVRELPLQELRSKIGLVTQKALLFTGTVAENIRFGREEAADEEIRKASETAQAAEFISEMPDGYTTLLAQGGKNLSGGQKQRISIARALLRRPEIYIFDDSFSALDFKTGAVLRSALRKEISGSAVFIVAQRVTTVMDADRIIVLDQGRIVGLGRHEDLLAGCPVYREIVNSQLAEDERT
ncbi:MAG: ABC transporter ATP-binding protein [Candidatus Wallbacteria bacterium]|nr:ABC transporter ATP-binding protein [Candidatus Wallbacteria bacterium]